MNPRIVEVTPNDNYTLTLHFTNGEVGIYDCKPLLNFGVFAELNNLAYFKRVQPCNGTVVWPNEQDICPDTLYLDSVKEIFPATLGLVDGGTQRLFAGFHSE